MSRLDELLRETLAADPQPAGTDGWDRVARRGGQLARQRRVRRAGIAGAVVVGLVVVSAVVLQRGSDESSRSIVANPSTPNESTIVASINGGVVTLDPSDGNVLSRLVDDTPNGTSGGIVPGVAVSPDATTLYYTRPSSNDSCASSVIVEHTIATRGEQELVCGNSPVVSPDGQWIAYTVTERRFDGSFLAMTALPSKLNYRPYEQLLGEQPSKVQPLVWSPDDRLLWNRFHAGSSDQQTFQLNSPPLDHGDQPTPLATRAAVGAATYLADGQLAVAQGSTDGWELDVLNRDGSIASTRFHDRGAMPTTISAAPVGDTMLLTMPDGRLLIQAGKDQPRTLATGVDSAVWLTTPPSEPDTTTSTVPSPASTTAPVPLDVDTQQPTFDEQVKQLETWYHNWPAEAPGGRPVLAAEWTFCDYRNNPDPSGFARIGLPAAPGIQPTFASYSKLSEPLTEARIVDGCYSRPDRFPGETPANVPLETPADQLPAYLLCASDLPGPNYSPGVQPPAQVVLKPAVVFSGTDCASAGYQDPPPTFIADLDRRRHIEIELRAVPKQCPTADDASRWAAHIARQELDQTWQAAGAGSTATCFRPAYIDWDNEQAGLMQFQP